MKECLLRTLTVCALLSVLITPQPLRADTEPNNDLVDAQITGLIGVGEVTITGDAIIDDPSAFPADIDLFKFTIPAASAAAPLRVSAAVRSNGSGLDPYVRLFNGAGMPLAGDDDIGPQNNDARLSTMILEPGTYVVGVSSSSNSTYSLDRFSSGLTQNLTMGDFELTITVEAHPPIDSSLEPNDINSNAVEVTGNRFGLTHQFIGDGPNGRADRDRYRITISAPTIIEATAHSDHLDSTLDPVISMGVLGENDDASPDTHDAHIRVAVFEPGDYFVDVVGAGRVEHLSGSGAASLGSVGLYDLDIALTTIQVAGGPHEPNDSIPEATLVGDVATAAVTLSGFLGDGRFAATRGDVDVYQITGDIGDIVTIDVNATGAAPRLDPLVTVFGYFGEQLARNDNHAGSTDSQVSAAITDPLDLSITPSIYVMVRGAGQALPADPFTPDPADSLPNASEHVVVNGPRSTGNYDITFTAGPPATSGIRRSRSGPGSLLDQIAEEQSATPNPFPSEPHRLFATQLGGAEDKIVELDPQNANTLVAFNSPDGVVGPHTGLAIKGSDLYVLGAGRYPRLYRMGRFFGRVLDSVTLWMGSGYYGDITELDGVLYVTDLIDQSVHALDPDTNVATAEIRLADLGVPRLKLSGPIGALPHPDRLILSDYARTDAVVYALDPATGAVDESLAALTPCPCTADIDGNGVINSLDFDLFFGFQPGDEQLLDQNCDGVIDATDDDIFNCQFSSGIPSDPACCPVDLPPAGVESILSSPCPCSGDFDFDDDVDDADAAQFDQCFIDGQNLVGGKIRTGCSLADLDCDGVLTTADQTIFNCRQAGSDLPPNSNCCSTGFPDVSVEAFALAGLRNDQIVVTDGETPILRIYDRGGTLLDILNTGSPLGSLGGEALFGFGDSDGDGRVDLRDFDVLTGCFSNEGVGVDCWAFDAQPDGAVNLRDFARFQQSLWEHSR